MTRIDQASSLTARSTPFSLLTIGKDGEDGVLGAVDEVAGGEHAQDEGKVPRLGHELHQGVAANTGDIGYVGP